MKKAVIIVLSVLYGCIGTDVRDDSVVPEMILITTETESILIGQTLQLEATYYNEYGIEEENNITWVSDAPEVASISENGVLTALSQGQARLTASFQDIISEPKQISVVSTEEDVAEIKITSPKLIIDVNESVQLMAKAYDLNGNVLPASITWTNKKPDVASLSSEGILEGKVNGTAAIEASSDGVTSNEFRIVVGNEVKTAMLQGNGGYNATGTATLSHNGSGQVLLNFSNDFQTDFALGTYIFLSNTTNGQNVKSGGLNLGEIKTGGAKTFNISTFDSSVELDTYQYVIVLCEPAGITFGFGDFNQ